MQVHNISLMAKRQLACSCSCPFVLTLWISETPSLKRWPWQYMWSKIQMRFMLSKCKSGLKQGAQLPVHTERKRQETATMLKVLTTINTWFKFHGLVHPGAVHPPLLLSLTGNTRIFKILPWVLSNQMPKPP